MPDSPAYFAIPEPCQEDWTQMTPTACGRFCQACRKEVLDFTDLAPADILAVLRSHPAGSVCGRIPTDTLAASYRQAHALPKRRHWPGAARLRQLLAALSLPLLVPPPFVAGAPQAATSPAARATSAEPAARVVAVRVTNAATRAGLGFVRVELWRLGAPLRSVQTEVDGSGQLPVPAEYWTDVLSLKVETPGFPAVELFFTPAEVAGVLPLPLTAGPVQLPLARRTERYIEPPQRSYMSGAVATISVMEVSQPRRSSWLRRAFILPPLCLFLRIKQSCQRLVH